MNKSTNKPPTVTVDAVRPAGKQDHCFYCGQVIGDRHKEDCVLWERKVVVTVTFELLRDVPMYWDQSMIEFQMNDGTYCMDNVLDQLFREANIVGEGICYSCPRAKGKYLRDASAEDIEHLTPIKVEGTRPRIWDE